MTALLAGTITAVVASNEDDPEYAQIRATLEQKLAHYQRHYADEPYGGAQTPHPEWGPYDEKVLKRVEAYAARVRATS